MTKFQPEQKIDWEPDEDPCISKEKRSRKYDIHS